MKAVQRACKDTPGSDETLDGTLKEFESLHADVSVGIRQFTNSFALLNMIKLNPFQKQRVQRLLTVLRPRLDQAFRGKVASGYQLPRGSVAHVQDQVRREFQAPGGEGGETREDEQEPGQE